jgi:hypothetical protein
MGVVIEMYVKYPGGRTRNRGADVSPRLSRGTVEISIRYINTSQVIELWEVTWEGGKQENH